MVSIFGHILEHFRCAFLKLVLKPNLSHSGAKMGNFLEYLLELCAGGDYYEVEKAVFDGSTSEKGYYDTNLVLRKV